MMGMMDLGLMDRESGVACPLTGRVPDPLPLVGTPHFHRTPESLPPRPGAGYAPGRRRGTVLAVILVLHGAAIAALATARYNAEPAEALPRVTSFSLEEPPPPPPMEPQPSQPVTQPAAAPIAAPAPPIEVPRRVEVQAVVPEAVRPDVAPVVAAPNEAATPGPAATSAAPPAPVIPPDFNAAQLRNPAPAYPFLSKRAKEEGVVLLKVLVGADGHAARLEIERSSGFDRLDDAALKTVRKWRFVPASQAGRPREAWVLVPVTFSLD